jgi:hypothetical protein
MRLFSKIIEQRAYVEKPQGFEVYQKETLVCRWKKILYGFKKLGDANAPPRARLLPQDLLFLRPEELKFSSNPLSGLSDTHRTLLMISLCPIGKSNLA